MHLSSFLSPAKLNLFFRVLHKRTDGYHEIASLYQAIDLFDRLFFAWASSDLISCTDPAVPCDSTNLVAKALTLYRRHYFVPPLHIHIEKHIPIQAGLGGGSSNAATTLLAVNQLMHNPASLQELIDMGAMLGSDVPFFFSSGTAYCTGRGEIIEPFQLPRPISGYLAKPPYGLSTPAVYHALRVEALHLRDPRESLHNGPEFYNDLEAAAFLLEPRLQSLKNELLQHFERVTLTGSGTAFFCLQGSPNPHLPLQWIPFHTIKLGE